jgi:hypothetical protein
MDRLEYDRTYSGRITLSGGDFQITSSGTSYTSMTTSSMKNTNPAINCMTYTNAKRDTYILRISNINDDDLLKLKFITTYINSGLSSIVGFNIFNIDAPHTVIMNLTNITNTIYGTANTESSLSGSNTTIPFQNAGIKEIVNTIASYNSIFGLIDVRPKLYEIYLQYQLSPNGI